MVTREVESWVESTTATNATATASRAAVATTGNVAQSHFITSVSGGYDATAGGTLILSAGATELARWHVYDSFSLSLSSPIRIPPGSVANLALSAGGAGIDGTAVMTGYTL